MESYSIMIKDTISMFLFLGAELSILFILISFAVSLLQQYIPNSKIQKILGGRKKSGYIFAALLGSITPFCSCSTIPMLRGLLNAKAGFGPVLTFLFTSPLINPIIVGLFLVTFGLKVTVIYVTLALGISILASVILSHMGYDRYIITANAATTDKKSTSCCSSDKSVENSSQQMAFKPIMASSCCPLSPQKTASACCSTEKTTQVKTSCCSSTEKAAQVTASCCSSEQVDSDNSNTIKSKYHIAFVDALSQFKSVLPYLLLGIGLGSLVYGFIPSEFIATYASGDNPLAVPIAAVIGLPLYIRAEAVIPLSAIFVAKGMGLGAIMALIIGSSGASLTEVILLKSMFKTPMIVAFVTVILGMAIFTGYLFQHVL